MSSVFYIIGVDHRVQAKPKGGELSEEQREFRGVLAEAIKIVNPVLVAEEYSQLALDMCKKRTGTEHESVTESVAREYGVEHRFCDADASARRKMGYMEGWQISVQMDPTGLSYQEVHDRGLAIEIAQHWPKRERFWLAQIGPETKKDLIFVCGDGHIDSFQELLKTSDSDSRIIARQVGVRPGDDDTERLKRAKAYLKAHPELYK